MNIASAPNAPTTPRIPDTTFRIDDMLAMTVELLSAEFTVCRQSLMRTDSFARFPRVAVSRRDSAESSLDSRWRSERREESRQHFVALGLQLRAGRTELMLDGGDRVLGILDSVFERRHVDDSEGDRNYGDEEKCRDCLKEIKNG